MDLTHSLDALKAIGRCPLCHNYEITSIRRYMSHIGDHLERLALFALPNILADDSDDTEEDREDNGDDKSDEELPEEMGRPTSDAEEDGEDDSEDKSDEELPEQFRKPTASQLQQAVYQNIQQNTHPLNGMTWQSNFSVNERMGKTLDLYVLSPQIYPLIGPTIPLMFKRGLELTDFAAEFPI
jgi:hypothetical protein